MLTVINFNKYIKKKLNIYFRKKNKLHPTNAISKTLNIYISLPHKNLKALIQF